MNSKDQATQMFDGRQGGSGAHEGAFEALALPHLESLYRTAMRVTRNCMEITFDRPGDVGPCAAKPKDGRRGGA